MLLGQGEPGPALNSRAQALAGDGKLFAYSVSDGTVHIAALPEGKPIVVASGFAAMVDDLEFSPDGKQLASVAEDGKVRIVACADGKLVHEFKGPAEVNPRHWHSRTIDFVDDGTKLLLAGSRSKARLIEREDGAIVQEFALGPVKGPDDEEETITASAVSADRKHFALGDQRGRYAVFSARTGALEKGPFEGPNFFVYSLDFDHRGTRLAIGAGDCKVRVLSLEENLPPREFSHCDQDLSGDLNIGSVRFAPDGKSLLAVSFPFWEVRLWDLETEKARWAWDYGGGSPGAIQARFTPDGSRVIVSRGGVRLESATGTKQSPLVGESEMMTQFRISGQFAWTVGGSVIQIYDIGKSKLVCVLPLTTAK